MSQNRMTVYKTFLDKEDFKAGRHFLPEVRFHRYLELLGRKSQGPISEAQRKAYYDQIYLRSTPRERETVVPCPVCTQVIAEAQTAHLDPFEVDEEVVARLQLFGIRYKRHNVQPIIGVCG